MVLKAVTFYDVGSRQVQPKAVFRLINGEIEIEDILSGDKLRVGGRSSESTRWLQEWLEGTWDADEERMVTPEEGERYLQALVERPMTYSRFEPGEPDARFGWHAFEQEERK
jgi:hypothetical protein